MQLFPIAIQRLIREFSRLPSIGERSATRLAYHVVNNDPKLARSLADALIRAAEEVRLCEQCFFFSEQSICPVCSNASRDTSVLCVVEKPVDLLAIERVGEYRGLYHVLHGLWAPLKGQGPESMKLQELLVRIGGGENGEPLKVGEVILATSSTIEGDATALYIAHILQERGIRSTRLAQGMPKGGELEYADDVTLSRAFAGRNTL